MDCFTTETQRNKFFLTVEFTLDALSSHHCSLWFHIIQLSSVSGLDKVIRQYVEKYPDLAYEKDAMGRVAVEIAPTENKSAILSVFLWHGRYRVTQTHPEHMSSTCYVYKAVDEGDLDAAGHPRPVALKLVLKREQFLAEVEVRKQGILGEYVVGIIRSHPALNADEIFDYPEIADKPLHAEISPGVKGGVLTKDSAEKLFCLVMPLADRNMFVALKQERFAGTDDLVEVRHIFRQLLQCMNHLYEHNVIHADIKTLNIVRTEAHWKLIDLDAACLIGVDTVGLKSSTCYVPPEALMQLPD